ncbi:plasmid mobilization relaxosome protein MobC [Amycolatopsis rubida]|uniref:Mobilisation protein (MobC) n=1 Tax=Amycolatopsis rubida TaxID=112413 RepID=A0A1I5XHA0_9PSEU|nr:plasmid mobilization relaxosome protein MobC [Amycolatopsis rubida]SFQ31348.1 mobilisation protein (MobC) [Amycolatopsis rubida]
MQHNETGVSAAGEVSAEPARTRGHSHDGPRRPRTSLAYNDVEWSIIEQAAALDGRKPGSWASLAALDAARMRVSGVVLDRGVLSKLYVAVTDLSNQLAKIGGNLNDVAKHANSTHEVETVREQALAILERVRLRVVEARGLLAGLRHALR